MRKHLGKWSCGILVIAMVAATACQSMKKSAGQTEDPAASHNSRNSLDWAGTYQGTLPCADCPGINTTLNLEQSGAYTLQTRYLERGDSVYTTSGKFKWDNSGGRVILDNNQQFQVGENHLVQLDQEGNRISGGLAEHYVLKKMDNAIVGRYWKLVELNGRPVEAGSTQKEPYIRLTAEENRLEGTGGCNGMGGIYELKAPNRVRFSKMIRTMMACKNLEVENELMRVLETTDSYHVSGDSLQLFRARMAPLAKFIAVASE